MSLLHYTSVFSQSEQAQQQYSNYFLLNEGNSFQMEALQFGIDLDGPAPENEDTGVVVPDTACPVMEEQLCDITAYMDQIKDGDNYEINMYIDVRSM